MKCIWTSDNRASSANRAHPWRPVQQLQTQSIHILYTSKEQYQGRIPRPGQLLKTTHCYVSLFKCVQTITACEPRMYWVKKVATTATTCYGYFRYPYDTTLRGVFLKFNLRHFKYAHVSKGRI